MHIGLRSRATRGALLALAGIGSLTSLPAVADEHSFANTSEMQVRHVELALLGHWASSPEAWDRALGARVTPLTCRPLEAAREKPGVRA